MKPLMLLEDVRVIYINADRAEWLTEYNSRGIWSFYLTHPDKCKVMTLEEFQVEFNHDGISDLGAILFLNKNEL